jgi:outer membrane protein OmpA-like peptidoglycan-associated protein/tetratricopeptide (TPR) repeat protein
MNYNKNQFFIALLAITLLASCARVNIKDGMQAFNELRYQDATTHLAKGLQKIDDPEARRALAQSYASTNRYAEAKSEYEVLALSSAYNDQDRIAYGQVLMSLSDYEAAETIFSGLLSRDPSNNMVQTLRNSCRKVAEMRSDSSRYDVSPVFTSGVTTAYAPRIVNGMLYFSGTREGSGEKDPYTGLLFTDLYEATMDGVNFGQSQKVQGVNGKYHDGIAAFSADGSTMVLTRSNYGTNNRLTANADDINTMQLYQSSKDGDGKWQTPQLVSFCDKQFMYAHPEWSKDGKTLFFSSDMAGGYGGMDLYSVSYDNGVWGKPVNLGALVNTAGNEVFPTLRSADSLYFSSNAHQNLGGLDLMYSIKQNNQWSAPVHLSYPLNTPFDDFGVAFTGDKSTGFFSSDRSGRDQIYSFAADEMVYSLSGLITRKFDDSPIEKATITITNLTDGIEEVIETDDVGMFELGLLPGKDYRVRVEREGYFAVTENISTRNENDERDIKLNVALLDLSNPEATANGTGTGSNKDPKNGGTDKGLPDGLDQNAPYSIPNILWDYNKWDIREDARPYLDYVAKLLKDNPELKVEISSHCDSRGSEFFNDRLSEKRAKAVSEYLVKKGVRRSMLISRGYGKSRLINRCNDGVTCSEEEHQANRRTEFQVVGGK